MKKILIACMLALPLAATALDSDTTPEVNVENRDFAAGKKAIAAKDWKAAVDAFNRAAKSEPRNPDIHNYLGYSYRNLDKLSLSFKHYDEALRLEPNHRGAHNYVGIAHLKSGSLDKAAAHLVRLEKICGRSCAEYADLSKAIAAYQYQPAQSDALSYGY